MSDAVLGVLLFAMSVILDLVVGEAVDITPYSVINILIDFITSVCMTHTHKAQVCRMLVLLDIRSNGSVSECSIPFTCAKHLQETAKREREVMEP